MVTADWNRDHRAALLEAVGAAQRPNGLTARTEAPTMDPDLDQFLNEPEEEHDWAVPGLFERGERVILTGLEGDGKSTLLRQTGVKSGAGLHPLSDDVIEPLRVLLIDLENGRRHVRRQLRPLRISAGERLKRGQVIVICRPEGLDLLQREDRRWMRERATNHRPDLLIAGPLYKLATGEPTEEATARQVAKALDELRIEHNCALFLEAHQPYGTGSKRPERPYGASLWSRWPEFGIHLSGTGELRHWRGARDEREWPAALKRGGSWPWTIQTDGRAMTFARLLDEIRSAGRRLSERELADALSQPKTTIHRAIEINRAQFDAVCEEVEA